MCDLQNVLVCQNVEFLTHVFQGHVHLQQITFTAHQNAFELLNQVLPLLEKQTQSAQG